MCKHRKQCDPFVQWHTLDVSFKIKFCQLIKLVSSHIRRYIKVWVDNLLLEDVPMH